MKISFQITAGAVWLDTVQHQPVNCSQPARQPRWQSALWAKCTQSSIYRTEGSWVTSHDELMTAGGQNVRELAPEMTHRPHHHHKQALDGGLSLPLLWLSVSVPGNAVCSFPVRWKWRGETVYAVCVPGLPVVQLTGHEIGQQAPLSQTLGPTDIPFLLLEWKIDRTEALWPPQWLSRD